MPFPLPCQPGQADSEIRLNGGSTELPLITTDGERVGSIEQLEEALEFGEVKSFLRLDKAPAANDDLDSLTAEEAEKLANELDDMELQQQPSPATAQSELCFSFCML